MSPTEQETPAEQTLLAVLLLVQVLFAGISVAGKFVLPYVPPLALALCRLGAAAVVLFAVERVFIRSRMPSRRDLGAFAVLALLGVVLNQGLFLMGLERTTATHAVLLIATIPAFTLLVATLLRHERPTGVKVGGLALSFAGVALLVVGSGFNFGDGSLVGNLLIAGNALSYSAYLVLSRPYLARHDPLTVIAWTFLFGFFEMALFAIGPLMSVDWNVLPSDAWWAFAYIIVGATILSYGLNNWVLRSLPASRVASFVYVQPLLGVLLAALLLDERITGLVVASGVLILGGVFLANRVAPSRRAGTGA